MSTKCYAQVRGSVIRVTKLDACGNPMSGSSVVAVSKRISTITINEVTDSGTNIRDRNFGDELTVVDDAFTETVGYTATTTLCGVDPALVTLMSGQKPVANASGDIVGFDVETGVDLDAQAFALEVWSKIAGAACDPSGHRQWGYTIFPFLKGGRVGNFSFQNGLVQFVVDGAQTRDGSNWGVGPFDVDRDASGNPAPLASPLTNVNHFRNILVSLDPPVASCGAFALSAGSF